MHVRTTAAALLSLGLFAALAAAADDEMGFLPLFDGKTLSGWKQLGGKAKYVAEDGAIVGSSVPNTSNSFLCTEKNYGDFILELEFKVDPGLNSGVQVRNESKPDYKKGQVHGVGKKEEPMYVRWRNIRLKDLAAGAEKK